MVKASIALCLGACCSDNGMASVMIDEGKKDVWVGKQQSELKRKV
jgi:hypothetical protein